MHGKKSEFAVRRLSPNRQCGLTEVVSAWMGQVKWEAVAYRNYTCAVLPACLMVERRARERKVASSNPGRRGGEFSFSELTLGADFYSVSVPPPCYRTLARKRPRSFCLKCGWQVNLNMHRSLIQRNRSGLTVLPIREKRAHTQLVWEHSARVVWAFWAIVD